jgi:hypothetical protein
MRISRIGAALGAVLGAAALAAPGALAQSAANQPASGASPQAASSPAASPTLTNNQTAGFGNGKLFTFTYTENFDCVDEPGDDLNFNGVPVEMDPSEIQTPICEVGTSSVKDPTGVPVKRTDQLYVLLPFFSVSSDTNPDDALPCPANAVSGEVCGPALGSFLIANFGGSIPDAFRQPNLMDSGITTQCPGANDPAGSCTMHGDLIDLAPALGALGVPGGTPYTPTANVFTPLPNHSHVINMDLNHKNSVWWQVIPVLVENPSDWPSADGTSGITSVKALDASEKAKNSIEVPSNFFLFFGSQRAK